MSSDQKYVAQTVRIFLQCRRPGFDLWVGKILWRRKWLPIQVFLPGKFHRQRSLAGYSPWGCKELDMTERLTHTFFFFPPKHRIHDLTYIFIYVLVTKKTTTTKNDKEMPLKFGNNYQITGLHRWLSG